MESENNDGGLFDLDMVRSLHKTVIALRTALAHSKAELELVKKSCLTMSDKKVTNQTSEETDEIELIFTTDDATNVSLHEDLVSIDNVIETDISKCGANSKEFKNSKFLSPLRPILKDITLKTQEVEAQTDITALPLQWRSEGFLINQKNVSPNTTLPSKFIAPVDKNTRKQCLRVSKKTTESRRVMLSDINFTSMVPELSRSVDHLCKQSGQLSREPSRSKFLKSPGYFSIGSSSSKYDFGSVFSVHSSCYRCQVRPSVMSLEARHNYGPWSSVPSSPTKYRRSASVPCEPSNSLQDVKYSSSATLKAEDEVPRKIKNKVSFRESRKVRMSMPDLRKVEEDSTDSLIEESECVVRNAIDSLISGYHVDKKGSKKHRRYSEPYHSNIECCSIPITGKPYLPKSIYDIQPNAYVKVITSFGRVVGARVRYIGCIAAMTEPYIGVQFDRKIGDSDGMYNGIKYFECGINNGQFIPFQKIVLAWRDM
ncbi:uncharacterized protein LOC126902363 [Daktulosphaira vitifoliae]|uniref:uncharacterized protein LOC126902363 n=1 Tax=Daktulosphaira vitifoliae TaxID=58002 RepID=UPI0021AA7FBC|nr:uncharacterized protein LOC126902363 [Daktulosphaira vitifoliae]